MKKNTYYKGVKGEKYGIYNTVAKKVSIWHLRRYTYACRCEIAPEVGRRCEEVEI